MNHFIHTYLCENYPTIVSEYGESHRNQTNKLIHLICAPAILFSLVGLLSSIPANALASLFPEQLAPFMNYGTVFLLFSLFFYLRLSLIMSLGMLLIASLVVWGIMHYVRPVLFLSSSSPSSSS